MVRGKFMKRDMDLLRDILIQVELSPNFWEPDSVIEKEVEIEIPEYSKKEINYHLKLLVDSGFLYTQGNGSLRYRHIVGLTWNGHEFLDLMREDTIWNRAKEVMKKTGGMAFEVLLKVLLEYATSSALGRI
jgi:hypothetical protein